MKQWLLNIRQPGKRYTVWEGIRRILLCLVLGILLGMLAKQLDLASYGGNSFWERALEWLDLRNFLSDFPFWLAVGLAIAVFAPSAFQAGDGVFFFFLGMCGAYHWYSVYVGGLGAAENDPKKALTIKKRRGRRSARRPCAIFIEYDCDC